MEVYVLRQTKDAVAGCRAEALAGDRMPVPTRISSTARASPPFPVGLERALFGMGCFWGAEKKFWQLPGVYIDGGRVCRRLHAEPDLS